MSFVPLDIVVPPVLGVDALTVLPLGESIAEAEEQTGALGNYGPDNLCLSGISPRFPD